MCFVQQWSQEQMTEYCVDDQNWFHFTKITIFIKKKNLYLNNF